MQRYILTRVFQGFITLWALSFVVFISAHLTGDPAVILLPPEASAPEDYELMKRKLGLDKSKPEQYLIFMKNAVRLDFGLSTKDWRPARDILLERLPATIQLSAAGMGLAILLGIPLGILSAVKRNSIFDYLSKFFAVVGMAAPQFWVAIMLILFLRGVPENLAHLWTGRPRPFHPAGLRVVLVHHGRHGAVGAFQYAGNTGQRVR